MSPDPDSKGVAMMIDSHEDTAVAERRASVRIHRGFPVKVTSLGQNMTHACHAEDLSEGGLYVHMPTDSALTVGQRCELTFEKDAGAPDLPNLGGETCYATVVRTKLLKDGVKSMIGAGLRFDQPIYL